MLEDASLYDAFLACKSPNEVRLFIADLLSIEEIERAEDRWAIALRHMSNPKVFTQSKLKQLGYGSSDKIGRIIRPTKLKDSGYRIVYERLADMNKERVGEAQ